MYQRFYRNRHVHSILAIRLQSRLTVKETNGYLQGPIALRGILCYFDWWCALEEVNEDEEQQKKAMG
jgi:hypothetical protein